MTSLLRPRNIPKQTKPLDADAWVILHALDAQLRGADGQAVPDYKTLRTKLDQIPRAQRGVDWTERVVKIYCKHRLKAQRCQTLKTRIKAHREAEGKTDAFTAFCDELTALTAPYVLTMHGYTLPFRNRDIDEVTSELTQIIAILDNLGVQSFINSGTLLGAVREGAFLGHDDDADLAVLIDGSTDDALVTGLFALGDRLNQTGALQSPAAFSKRSPVIKIEMTSGVVVDLFPMWIRDDRVFIWPHTFGELHRDDVFPLGSQMLNGAAFPAPCDADKMLALNYGAGWRSPDAHFQFPWKEAREKFAAVITCYKRRKSRARFLGAIPGFRGR